MSPKRIWSVNYTVEAFTFGAVIRPGLWDFTSLVQEWCRREFFYVAYICAGQLCGFVTQAAVSDKFPLRSSCEKVTEHFVLIAKKIHHIYQSVNNM
jgi:hypothetical protein